MLGLWVLDRKISTKTKMKIPHTKNLEALILSRRLLFFKILIVSPVMIYAICKVKQRMKTTEGSEMPQSAHPFTSFSR